MKQLFLAALALLTLLPFVACTRTAPVIPTETQPPVVAPTLAAPTALPTATPLPTSTPIPAARVESGDRALFDGDWEKALQEYQDALQISPDAGIQAAALLGVARSYWTGRSPYEARQAVERLLRDYPFFPRRSHAYFLLAQIETSQERYAEAADAYTQYIELNSGVIDAYILDLRGDANFSALNYAAAAQDFKSAIDQQSRLNEEFLHLKMARAYTLAGDQPAALAIYDDVYARSNDEDTKALICLRKGEIYTELGEIEPAQAAYLETVQNYPASYNSYTALVALVDAGVAVDELQRGIVDYHAGEYGVAQAALDRYLQNNPSNPGAALYYYGLTERKLGEYTEAIKRWDTLIQNYPEHVYWDEAWEEKAYTQWAFLNEYRPARETLLKFVEENPYHARAAEFLFDAALVAEREDKLEIAEELFDRAAREYPSDERAPRAMFLLGITLYRLKDYANAMDAFSRMAAMAPPLGERSAAQYWIGKSYLALGDEASARTAWEKAAEIDPTGYYSERAQDRLYNRPPFDPPLSFDLSYDLTREHRRAEDWIHATFSLPQEVNLADPGVLSTHPALRRGIELWELGLYDDARSEFEAVREEFQSDPANLYRLANVLVEVGAYRPAIMAGRQVLSLAGMSDADTFNAPIYFNHLRFGAYYQDIIVPLARQHELHPLFLYSVVRQESLFEGFVRSSAGASGLMQVIPSTGAEIAGSLGWPANYTAEDLNRPIVNLTFGVNYLARQLKAFNGDEYVALAAYNGGPGNAQQWARLAGDDQDLFLEVIRYSETREYIRRVYELFNIYRLLYDRTP